MNLGEKDNLQQKRAYSTPVVEKVDLRPEEAVLGACKSATTGNAVLGGTNCGSFDGQCSTFGS